MPGRSSHRQRMDGRARCFTCKIKAQYRRSRRELFPVLSRMLNIGYELGENGRSPEWYRANHRMPWVAVDAGFARPAAVRFRPDQAQPPFPAPARPSDQRATAVVGFGRPLHRNCLS
jgi:hypothetical protein